MESKVVTTKQGEQKGSSSGKSQGTSGGTSKGTPSGRPQGTPSENQPRVDIHKQAAKHHQDAAKHHQDAAKFHEQGQHDKAAASTVKAQGSATLANDASREDSRSHAING